MVENFYYENHMGVQQIGHYYTTRIDRPFGTW